MHAEDPLQRRARRLELIGGVDRVHHDGDARQLADRVGGCENFFRGAHAAFVELHRFGAQHEMREIDVPRMRRDVRAFALVAEVAQITVVDHLPVVVARDTVDFHGLRFVDQVEQRGERVAQTDAAAATVAEVKHALQFVEQFRLVVEPRIIPVNGVAGRRFEAAFGGRGRRFG